MSEVECVLPDGGWWLWWCVRWRMSPGTTRQVGCVWRLRVLQAAEIREYELSSLSFLDGVA